MVSSIPPGFPSRVQLSVRWLFGAYSVAFGPSSLYQLHALRASVTHLALRRFSQTQTHSTTTLAYESAAPTLLMAKLIMHRHVLNAWPRFHLPTLADTTLSFSHCVSTSIHDALNPPRIVASATHSRGHVSIVSAVSLVSVLKPLIPPCPNTAYCLLNHCLGRATEKGRKRSYIKGWHDTLSRPLSFLVV